MTVNGIDIAAYQPNTFATTGLGAVIVKATEGTGYVNPRHAAQVAYGRAHDLVVGHYHFVRPGSMSEQVAYFLNHAAAKAGDVLALDWEDAGVPDQDKDAWIRQAQKAAPAHQVLLYCNRDFWLNRDRTSFAGDGLWIADPSAAAGHPRVEAAWIGHQHSSAGGLDRDVFAFPNAAGLRAWALKGAPAAPKPPAHEPFPGAGWFVMGRHSPIVRAMHQRLVDVDCSRYRSHTDLDEIGPGDVASYEAWQRAYSIKHKKGWTGAALEWPPGKESWDALQVPNV